MAWIGGAVGGAAGAVAAGTKKNCNKKASCIYLISIVVALIAFVIVVSLYSN